VPICRDGGSVRADVWAFCPVCRHFFCKLYCGIDKTLVLISLGAIETRAGVVPVRMVRTA
jgi:hypothetical protein